MENNLSGNAAADAAQTADRAAAFFTKPAVVCIGAIICCILWGSAFPCVKIGYSMFSVDTGHVPSIILFAGLRFTLAGILAIIIGSVISKKPLFPKRSSWPKIIALSFLQTVGQYVFFYISLANSTGVRSSILNGVNVFVAIFVACLLFKQEKLTAYKIAGSIAGFAGLVVVCLNGSSKAFAPKTVGGLGADMFSRRFDIEMKTVYFYTLDGEEFQKVSCEIPMLFVQEEYLGTFSADVSEKNEGLSLRLTVSQSVLSATDAFYELLLPAYDEIARLVTPEMVVAFIEE